MSEALKDRTAKGFLWGSLNSGAIQVLNLLFGIILARCLSPEDYGMVGVLMIFVNIAGCLQACGFTQALINIKKPTDDDYNSVFWFNVLVSTVIYIILFLSAPLISAFFGIKELEGLSRLLFLCIFISSLGITRNAYMLKNMMNKELAVIGIVALLVSGGIGIGLAMCGYGYWSLAWQQIAFISALNVGRVICVPWHPNLKIDFGPVRRMFAFSVKMLITNIINSVQQSVLNFIFGKLFPIQAVGFFSQANNWNTKASSVVSGAMQQVAQPVLVEVADDAARRKQVLRKMLRFASFITFPMMLGLAMVAHEFIILTITDKWLESVPLLRVLCVGGAFLPIVTLFQSLTVSSGRSGLYMWMNIAQVLSTIAVVLLCYTMGMMVMVWLSTALYILWVVPWIIVVGRQTGLTFIEAMKDIMPFLLISVVVMAVAYFITLPIKSLWLLLIARIVAAVVLYYGIMWLLKATILKECIQFIKNKGSQAL